VVPLSGLVSDVNRPGNRTGVVGVVGGLEAIRALRRSGFRPKHSIELLVFTSEEPTRFGIGCLGSRLLSGTLSAETAANLVDRGDASVEEVRLAWIQWRDRHSETRKGCGTQ
jgi:ureidoglycolate amidohydrolase